MSLAPCGQFADQRHVEPSADSKNWLPSQKGILGCQNITYKYRKSEMFIIQLLSKRVSRSMIPCILTETF